MATKNFKNQINRNLYNLTANMYFKDIPLDEIFNIVNSCEGLQVVDEAGDPWCGFLCGENSEAHFKINGAKFYLHMTWYKMDFGKWEIVAYVN